MPQFDKFIVELELQMDKLYMRLLEMVKGAGIIEFSTLIKGVTRLEAIRTFILLLFLAQNSRINLWQNEESQEIYITVGDLNLAGSEKASPSL
jgi:chromatin segregation and condensation protein Rec8/ScpA/Scc1 (kleisin family)